MIITEKYLDSVVTDCVFQYGVCPFGCGKDGGANCHQNIKDTACPPAKNWEAMHKDDPNFHKLGKGGKYAKNKI